MPDYISRKEYCTPQSTARTIQRGIIEVVKSYIQQRAKKLTLTFDIEGVRNMLTFICEHEYDARNYTYTDDWSLAKLRDESDFIKLEEEQKINGAGKTTTFKLTSGLLQPIAGTIRFGGEVIQAQNKKFMKEMGS